MRGQHYRIKFDLSDIVSLNVPYSPKNMVLEVVWCRGYLEIKVQNDAVKTNSWSSVCTETREMQFSCTI